MCSDSPLHFMYPSLNLRSLSTVSINTNLHIFLSLPFFCLLVAGWWLTTSYRCFNQPWESQNFRTLCQKYLIFVTCKDNVTFGVPHPILCETGTEIFKTREIVKNIIPRNIWGVKLGYDLFLSFISNSLFTNHPVIRQYTTRVTDRVVK